MREKEKRKDAAVSVVQETLCRTILIAISAIGPVCAQSPAAQALAGASLEDLMKIDVTSVSKKDQTLSKTGAAVFVISQEDIRRSGASNIPDVLRMAPGVEVAQINANRWAISIRGFNAVFSNKVLVLIDGRTLYTDSFSGVYWDEVDTPLEDIERIEVIRGPGGTVWGANAVNGVINIITKSAADTKGGTVVAGSGSRESAQGTVQYGGDAGSRGAYRVFGKYFNDDDSPLPGGTSAVDGWHTSHFGGRADWRLASGDTVSLQGDFLNDEGGETSAIVTGLPPSEAMVNSTITNRSGDVLARWRHILRNGSETSLQVYDNAISRKNDGVNVSANNLDVEFQHHLAIGSRQDVVWGADYRLTRDVFEPFASYAIQVDPPVRSNSLFAAFVQDEIRLAKSVFLTVGAKIEHNAYTGFEPEPSVQLVWSKSARQTFWASAGRAIREPNTVEHGMKYDLGVEPVPGVGSAVLLLSGNPHLLAEQLTDFETGYRTQVNPRVSLDITGFLSYYHHLATTEAGTPYVSVSQGEPLFIIPLEYENLAHARDYGIEFFGNWRPTNRWKISPGVTVLRMQIADDPGGNDSEIVQTAGDSPRQQFELRSQLSLPGNMEWDSSVKYVDALDGLNIPAYTRLDTRVGWRMGERTEISVSGQNLTSGGHFEFNDRSGLTTPSLMGRSVSAKLTFRF